jgi:Tfp pilus assembly protein PilO
LLQQVQTTSGELTRLQQTLQAIPSYMAALDSTTKERAVLAQKLYSPSEIAAMLEDMHDIASSEGLRVLELHPPLDEYLLFSNRLMTDPDSSNLTIRIVSEGRFQQYGRFLKKLEERAYFRALLSQTIASDIEKSAEQLRIDMMCRVLMSQPDSSSAGVES